MKMPGRYRELARRVHEDERGAVSLETILIIGAIALPILIFLLKWGWPRVRDLIALPRKVRTPQGSGAG